MWSIRHIHDINVRLREHGHPLIRVYICTHCGDSYHVYSCVVCGTEPTDACKECYYEITHNALINKQTANIPGVGGGTYGPHADDPGPAWENAIKALEDG